MVLIDHRFAIWLAGMVDEARFVSPHTRINDSSLIQAKEQYQRMLIPTIIVAVIGYRRSDQFAYILNNASALTDAP